MRHGRHGIGGGLAIVLALAFAAPAAARNLGAIVVRLPKVTLPPQSDSEICWVARIETTSPFETDSWKLVHAGTKGTTGPRHGLVYLYTGDTMGGFTPNQLVSSRGCLELGPPDRDRRLLIASGAARVTAHSLPAGVAMELAPRSDAPGGTPAAIGILIDVNWVNGDTQARTVSTKLVMKRAKSPARTARPFSDRSEEAGLVTAPFAQASTAALVDARWSPGANACVIGLSAQMHRRGRCVGIDQLDAGGQVKPPIASVANPCEPDKRTQMFVALDYSDPGSLAFTTPMAVGANESLRYSCWTDNGSQIRPVRLGCESSPGVPPGSAGTPATPCTFGMPASPECPGGGACVPANAVAGPDVDDEVCGITGLVYDAAPDGTCNTTGAP